MKGCGYCRRGAGRRRVLGRVAERQNWRLSNLWSPICNLEHHFALIDGRYVSRIACLCACSARNHELFLFGCRQLASSLLLDCLRVDFCWNPITAAKLPIKRWCAAKPWKWRVLWFRNERHRRHCSLDSIDIRFPKLTPRDHLLIESLTAIRRFLNATGLNPADLIVSADRLPHRVMLLQIGVFSRLNCLPLGLGHWLHSSLTFAA